MNQRTPNNRLERRSERNARNISSTPDSRRSREPQRVPGGPGGNGKLPFSPAVLAGILGAVVLVGILAYAVTQRDNITTTVDSAESAELDSDSGLPGTYIKPHPGANGKFEESDSGTKDDRAHSVPQGVSFPICSQELMDADAKIDDVYADRSAIAGCYHSNPPTSGPHRNPGPYPWKILDNPGDKENLVHNMEHGGVVVWYNTDDQAVIDKLTKAVNDELDRNRLVVMTKYTGMESNTIALTAWSRLDKFSASQFDEKRVKDFIEEHSRRFNPEGF